MTWRPDGSLYVTLNGPCPTDLSLINSQNATPGACPASGEVVTVALSREPETQQGRVRFATPGSSAANHWKATTGIEPV